jgi:hypothetical protein
MSFKEVKELRKAGKLEEALAKALTDLETAQKGTEIDVCKVNILENENIELTEAKRFVPTPNNLLWAKRSLAWVYYEYLRNSAQQKNYDSFMEYLLKIRDLQMPADEKLLFDSCAWPIGSMIFTLGKQLPVDCGKINEVFNIIRDFQFSKPSEAYSFIYKAFHKAHTNWPRYLEFADWWDFENFRPEDYLQEEFEGKKIMSIAEQAYIAYARKALSKPQVIDGFQIPNSVDKELLKSFLPKLDLIIEKHPDFQYPPYFKAKFLLALGENDNILSAILPFAKSKRNDFWVWDVLSDAYPVDAELYMACLCRSLLCRASNEFLVKVFEKLSAALISRKFYPEAKCLIETSIQTREDQNWAIAGNLKMWTNQPWYKETVAAEDIIPFLKKHAVKADELLFSDMPEDLIIAEFINSDKKILSFVADHTKKGFFSYEGKLTSPSVGDVYRARLKQVGKDGFFQVITLQETNEIPDNTVLKQFSGSIFVHENGYGIINGIFVDPRLIKLHGFKDNDSVTGTAIISYNAKKGTWGWKAIKIINKV